MEAFITSRKAASGVIVCIPPVSRQGYTQSLLEFVLDFSIEAPTVKTIVSGITIHLAILMNL